MTQVIIIQVIIAVVFIAMLILSIKSTRIGSFAFMAFGSIIITTISIVNFGFPKGFYMGVLFSIPYIGIVWYRFHLVLLYEKKSALLKSSILCGKCGVELPYYKNPKNLNQLLHGGWTCLNCGAELDKHGKEKQK